MALYGQVCPAGGPIRKGSVATEELNIDHDKSVQVSYACSLVTRSLSTGAVCRHSIGCAPGAFWWGKHGHRTPRRRLVARQMPNSPCLFVPSRRTTHMPLAPDPSPKLREAGPGRKFFEPKVEEARIVSRFGVGRLSTLGFKVSGGLDIDGGLEPQATEQGCCLHRGSPSILVHPAEPNMAESWSQIKSVVVHCPRKRRIC